MLGSYHVIDLRDSTQFTFNTPAREGLNWLAKYYRIINSVSDTLDGKFCSMLGDGTGVMYADQDHALRAVLSSCKILHTLNEINFPLKGNAGVDSGELSLDYLQTTHTSFLCPFGPTIITSFRTEGLASKSPFDILITESTLSSLGKYKNILNCFETYGTHQLKNIQKPVKLWGGFAEKIITLSDLPYFTLSE